ncbi:MAG: M28 family peptidase [Phycisphaerae bacterium]|nr:M28 family peptidase [Phycisphaerae bacterium]
MQLVLAVFLILAGLSYESAPAADVAEVVGQVSKESYTNYLRNDLYTHDGDERCFGPQHDLAQQRIRELFESFGLETSLHPFEYRETTCYNVVGVHRGISCPNEIYVLGAHYDSVEGSPGALDNGSGVAGILESARVLSQHAFEGTIVFIAFDREEYGLRGSRAYANDHIEDHIHCMLNLDCIAPQTCGPEYPNYRKIGLTYASRPNRLFDELLDDLTTAVESYTELTCVVRPLLGVRTDHLSFANVGFAAAGFDAYGCPKKHLLHTALDSVDQLDYIGYDYGTRVTQAVVACLATEAKLAPARIYPDFDGDGDVDIEDCVLLIEHWRGSDSQFDIAPPPNGDGVVNDQDLIALLHYWFSDRSSWWDFPQAQYSGGTGEPNDPYQIATAEDLMLLGESPYDYDKHFIMTADIDLDPNLPGRKVFDRAVIAPETNDARDPWGPAVFDGRPFTGVCDGNGHTISHLAISGGGYLGLFGQLGSGAKISNLGLEAVDVNGTGHWIGGLVGSNGHWDSGGGILTNCYSTGTVSGDQGVGGLVGWNGGTISVCSSNANVFGYGYTVGGLAGSNGGHIATSYSTGMVTGDSPVGGLVGDSRDGSITSSFWDVETSVWSRSAGGIGLTTAEMWRANTFLEAGWDLVYETENGTEDIWWIAEGQDYPRLWWQYGGAFWPDPVNGAANILRSPLLRWISGGPTMHHDVYFDQDADVVAEATPETQGVYRGRQPTEVTMYEPAVLDRGGVYYWRIDEVNEDDPHSPWKGSVWSFTVIDAITSPFPPDTVAEVSHEPVLSWVPGGPGLEYEVYFADDHGMVANATPVTLDVYCGRQSPEMTDYKPGYLEWGKTYYWRIDGVEEGEPNSPWKGNVWSFTTANFIVVDDFDSYNDIEEGQPGGNRIYLTWIDGFGVPTNGSIVGYLGEPSTEQEIVNGGKQSMPMDYNNVSGPYYSEAERTWETPQDWKVGEADTLTLCFRGEVDNDAEPLCVAIEGSAGQIAVATHPDADAVLATEWQKWHIPLADLQADGVNVASVKKMIIGVGDRDNPQPSGTGRIYIDDIRVTRRMT